MSEPAEDPTPFLQPDQTNLNAAILEQLWVMGQEMRTYFTTQLGTPLERVIDGAVSFQLLEEHMARYRFARAYVRDKNILDMACGSGYGTHYLLTAGRALCALGVDIAEDAIRYAKHRYVRQNLKYLCADACRPITGYSFDAAVSFETIEHVPEPDAMLASVSGMLTPEGMFIVSTPVRSYGNLQDPPRNPHHMREWLPQEFEEMLGLFFKEVKLYGQGWSFRNRVMGLRLSYGMARKLMRASGRSLEYVTSGLQYGSTADRGYDLATAKSLPILSCGRLQWPPKAQ